MPCANIFHGMAAPILGSHSFMVGWESMRLVTHEARDPRIVVTDNYRHTYTHYPATIVIKIIHEKPNFRLFVGLKFIND